MRVRLCLLFVLHKRQSKHHTNHKHKTTKQRAKHKTLALKKRGIASNDGEGKVRPLGEQFWDTICSDIVGERKNVGQTSVCVADVFYYMSLFRGVYVAWCL